jgi:hypothetical protein
LGSAKGRFAQRGVKNFLCLARVAQHQETKAIKLRQVLLSIRHSRFPRKNSANSTRIAHTDKGI